MIVQKLLPYENYIERRPNTNKTQIIHRIQLKKFAPNQPLEDRYRKQKLLPDEEIIIPQDDLKSITWEADFGDQLVSRGNAHNPTCLPGGEQAVASNDEPSDANENEVDYITTRDSLHDVSETPQRRRERLQDEISKIIEVSEASRNENSDWPYPAVYPN